MVVVITLNYNQNEFTLNCVKSILQTNYESFKIFIIDNGSTENNYEELKRLLPDSPLIELLRLDNNIGYVGGINYGFEKSSLLNPNFYLIMNNDTILDKNAITELVLCCKQYNEKAIVSGKVYHYDKPTVLQDVGYVYYDEKALKAKALGLNEKDRGQHDSIKERDSLDDVFWLLPSKLYQEIGGYSHYFWFNAEQADFALRAKKNGYKLIYTPKAKLWHKGSVSIGGRDNNPKLAYWHVQSTLILRYLHLSKYEFLKQYMNLVISIMASYYKIFRSNKLGETKKYRYANAKFRGWMYFNKWFFIRNANQGENPF